MPNDLSDEFHSIEEAIVAFFSREKAKIESGISTLLEDIVSVAKVELPKIEPIIIAAASAGVSAALAVDTGGLSSIASAAETAGLAVLGADGKVLAEDALLQFRTVIGLNVMQATASPYTKEAPGSLQAQQ